MLALRRAMRLGLPEAIAEAVAESLAARNRKEVNFITPL